MTDLYLIKNEVPAKTIPCMVLGSLQADLATIMKLKTMPYERTYILSEDSYVEISIQKLESGLFQLQIKSPDRSDTLTDPKLKKLVDMTHMLVWLALSTSLSRTSLPPCASTAHSGAHEILALYGCLEALKGTAGEPYSLTLTGPRGSYELFAVKQKGAMSEIVIETNYIYGNSMKWRAEVECTHQIVERAAKIMSDVLGEWLRPGGNSLRRECDRQVHCSATP